jgi:hypothetical protein
MGIYLIYHGINYSVPVLMVTNMTWLVIKALSFLNILVKIVNVEVDTNCNGLRTATIPKVGVL